MRRTKRLIGYADRFSVAAGETIRFMVSSEASEYTANTVRLIHGDENPDGPGYKEEAIETAADGRYAGRRQTVGSGSFVRVEGFPSMRDPESFTIQAWVYPTTPGKGEPQGLLTRWSEPRESGYGLFLGESGDLTLWLGSGHGTSQKVRIGQPLRKSQWYFVACSYDATGRKVCVYQQPLSRWQAESPIVVEQTVEPRELGEDENVAFLIGGGCEEPSDQGLTAVRYPYNGKIDGPRVFRRALRVEEIQSLATGEMPEDADEILVAAWDFAADVSSPRVVDTSRSELHGVAVNTPTRAVTGHNWTGEETNHKNAAAEYAAIHFHEDDLEDAGWETDFELVVPEGLRSGAYAMRLSSEGGDEDHLPFFVRPRRGTATAPIAFLVPTMTYLAYANERLYWSQDPAAFTGRAIPPEPEDVYLSEHPELGLSLYDVHADGSGCCYSSRLRPIPNMRPKYRKWKSQAPRHFSADLYVVDWLEERGYRYDVITDEDLHAEGEDLLAHYRVILTGTHPEYCTARMIRAQERYLDAGGRLMYLGGNGFYWVTSVDPARPHVIEVRRGVAGTRAWNSAPGEGHHSITGELGGLWRHRGKEPQKLVGVGFTAQGWGGASGYVRQQGSFDDRASFIFEGVDEDEVIGDFGLMMGGAAGDEIDRMDHALGTPAHALRLASSEGHSDFYQFVIEELIMTLPGQGGTENPRVRADMTFFETNNGGAVFSVGSINWCGALSHNGYDNNVSRITENVLRKFVDQRGSTGHTTQVEAGATNPSADRHGEKTRSQGL